MRFLVLGKLAVSALVVTGAIGACRGKDDLTGKEKEVVSEKEAAEAARILEQGPPTSPIVMAVEVDSTRETTEIIDRAGGVVRVTGSDGTKFTLELPKSAVSESTGITMTPVDSVSDLPFNGGLVGAVQLSPEGLVLLAPATLTIESGNPPAAKDRVAFGAASDGQGVYLAPLTRRSEQIQVPIPHFSIHGVVKAVPGALVFESGAIQWEQGYWPTPATALDRVQQEGARYFKELLILQEAGYEPGSPAYEAAARRAEGRVRAAKAIYYQDLARRLLVAGGNCSDLEGMGKVVAEYFSFERASYVLLEDHQSNRWLDQLIQDLMKKCARHAWERCRAGEIKGGLDMLRVARQYGALGMNPPYTDAEWKDLEKCPPIRLAIEDNNDIEFVLYKGPMLNVPKVTEKSRHVYRGFLYPDKDGLWRGGVDVSIEGDYTTIDEKAAKKRAEQLLPRGADPESMSLEELLTGMVGTMKFFASEIPSCKGSYQGKQFFTIEGSFTSGDQGQQQVELAFIPIEGKGPDFYRSSPECPWVELQELEGVEVIPTRMVKGQETAITIDPPKMGQPMKKYVIPVQAEGIRGETVIMVGGRPTE